MKLSVVIPMLNEAELLPILLDYWRKLPGEDLELLIIDGGSTDNSAVLAEQAGFRVIHTERGRARQMNAGAAEATGDILLFLHADTLLPPDACGILCNGLMSSDRVWGRFDLRIEGQSLMFPLIASLINLRSRLTSIATGDQAMFVRRDAFQKVGAFPDQPLMEDLELSKRLLRISRPLCLRAKVTTSGRRWQSRGIWRTIFLMWRLRWEYWRGASAQELAEAYL